MPEIVGFFGHKMEENLENENTYCVYKHTNKVNGMVYIGQTVHGEDPNIRWKYGKAYTGCPHFYSAIQKYGWDNFDHEILFNSLTMQEAEELETKMIKKYNSADRKFGYNVSEMGSNRVWSDESRAKLSKSLTGRHPTEETLKKLSESHKGKRPTDESRAKMSAATSGENHPFYGKRGAETPMYGKHHSEETRKKMSDSAKGRAVSEETKKKLSKIFKGRVSPMKGKCLSEDHKRKLSESHKGLMVGEKNPMYGKHLSAETKRKISESKARNMNDSTREKLRKANIGKKQSEELKLKRANAVKKKVVCLETNIVYDSATDASKITSINKNSIGDCCRHGKRKTAGGYHWEFYKDGENIENR